MIETSTGEDPRRTRAQLRTFIDHAPFSIAMFDRDLTYLAASQRWIDAYGRGRTTLVGVNHHELYPDMPERWNEIHRSALDGATMRADEDLLPRADGSPRWLRWAVLPWRDETGIIGGLVMLSEDITDRKRTEEVLRDSEQRYVAIFEESPFAIALTRASDMQFVDANTAFLKLFELERSELTGSTNVELGISSPESRDYVLGELAKTGKVRDLEVVRATRSGARRVVSMSLDWVTLRGERHILTTIRDITELKRAQETAALYEKTRELDRLKTELFANVSHELRTPLALIIGPTEQMLASSTLDLSTRRQLGVIHRNAQILSRHVEDLLEVARIDAGHIHPLYTPVDIAWLIRFVAGHFQALAADHKIAFTLETPERFVALVDRDMVQRILVNIIGNAFRFTPDGGIVRVSLRDRGPHVRIEVADSGPGIPLSQRTAVFDRFMRLNAGPRPYGGTGLGLAIVRELVGLHAGNVAIDTAPEGGALFVVELPVAGSVASESHPAPDPRNSRIDIGNVVETLREPAPAPAPRAPDGPLVLVVEDNREMNAFVAACLSDAGYRVETAYDGAEGIEKAVSLVPDLVLTDIMMPLTSGDELVRVLRQRPELDSTPIVVLSAKADAELRVKLLIEGAQDWLQKPFSVRELGVRVANLLARKRADEEIAALQRQVDEVGKASRAVADAVASLPESSVRAVLQTIAMKAAELTSAQYAAVGIGRDPDQSFNPWVYVGISGEQAAAIGRPPRAIGTLGAVATGHTTRLRDLRLDARHLGFPPDHPTMTSFLGVPIRYHEASVGTLYLTNKSGAPEFTDQDQRIVEMLADRVGVAIETARLYAAVGRERSWLQAVIDQMPEPIVLMDESGRITAQNRAALALAAAAESLGNDPYGNPIYLDLCEIKGERLPFDRSPIIRALRDRESTHALELVVRHANGSPLPVLASATPIFTADGELAGATMLLQDVSTLKQLERLREEWASIVAHDLQQPINAIVLLTDLLLRDALEQRVRERVERVRRLSTQLGRMVGDLADASQLEAHRIALKRDPLELSAFVRGVIDRIPALAARASVLTPPDDLVVDGDAGRLEQVLTNLLTNALKYGHPDTAISVVVVESDGSAHISITNQGPGIPADEIPVLFDRFVRTRDAAAGEAKGTGLGLYIAKGLVEAHGGRIWVESTPGRATTFHVAIPLHRSESQRQ